MKKIFLILLLVSVSIVGYGQKQEHVTIRGKMNIKHFFSLFEQQTKYTIAFKESDINTKITIDADFRNSPAFGALSAVLEPRGLTYGQTDRQILIHKDVSLSQICGCAFDQSTLGRIAYSTVVLKNQSNRQVAAMMTDSLGSFVFTNLKAGQYTLTISNIYYVTQAYTMLVGQQHRTRQLNAYLKPGENKLHEVIILSNEAKKKLSSTQTGFVSLSQQQIEKVPSLMGEPDVIKALQTLPGVSSGIQEFAGMYVRGGENDQNLMMLDGIPLYQINHLGGFFSPFNTDAVDHVDFYKSGFPSRYGGRLSSVTNIYSKDGDLQHYHGKASLGLIDGKLNFEGPIIKNRTGFSISLRRSWLDLLSTPVLAILNKRNKKNGKSQNGDYAFTDINAKITHIIDPKNKLFLLFYYGSDHLSLSSNEFPTPDVDPDDQSSGYNKNRLKWGNLLIGAGWKHKLNNRIRLDMNVSYTDYFSTIDGTSSKNWQSAQDGKEQNSFHKKKIDNQIGDLGLRVHFVYQTATNNQLRFGLEYTYHHFMPENIKEQSTNGSDNAYSGHTEQIGAHEVAPYIEDTWAPSRLLKLNGGLRLTNFNSQGKTYYTLEPRFSARIALMPDLSFKASYARMSQFVQQISNSYISLPTDFWMPIGRKFSPLMSDQVSGGLYYNLKNTYSFSVEGYYKWMNNLLEYKDGYNFMPSNTSWDNRLTAGKGTAYGIDFYAEKRIGRLTGSVGYGLLWTDRVFAQINRGLHFPAKYDNRHKINIALSYKINKKIDVNLNWVYMTGNRITLALDSYQDIGSAGLPPFIAPQNEYKYDAAWGIPYYDKRNNVRLPAYHRLDLGVNFYQPHKHHRLGIWNVSLFNAYSRMNPIVIQKTGGYNYNPQMGSSVIEPNRFMALAIFPIIPSVSYTYKF